MLDRQTVHDLLRQLGAELDRQGIQGELYVVGGAAMALAYDRARLTRDIDAVFVPKSEVYAAATHVAERHHLPTDWLNDAVQGLLPPVADADARVILDVPGLSVLVASPEHLLAMKVAAARVSRDRDDILYLCDLLGLRSFDEVLDLAEAVLGPGRLTPAAQFLVVELLQEHLSPAAEGRGRGIPQSGRGDTERSRRSTCALIVASTGLPCRLPARHGGRCRSR